MRIDRNTFEEILITITRNKTRSFLTAFGVFWGIFMLVTLLGGGQGMKQIISTNFQGFATNSAFIVANKTDEAYKGFQKGRSWDMDITDMERIKAIEGVDLVSPLYGHWGKTAIFDENKTSCTVSGVYPNYQDIDSKEISFGRWLNDIDIAEQRKVCVIGKQVYEDLFKHGEDPCGKFVQVDGTYYRIVGVNVASSTIQIGGRQSTTVFVPFTTVQQVYNEGNLVDVICFTMKPGYKVSEVEETVKQRIKAAHYISPSDKQAMKMLNAEAMFSMVDNLMTGIQLLIWMVGLGTLIAGAIGVSNIMMVTVKERTTEIGIRRAIGARPRDILQQILSESLVITIVAGMAGISFSVFVLNVLETAVNASATMKTHFQVSFWLAIGTCVLLAALGLLAGLAPAYRAMAIKPIDAIREE